MVCLSSFAIYKKVIESRSVFWCMLCDILERVYGQFFVTHFSFLLLISLKVSFSLHGKTEYILVARFLSFGPGAGLLQ